MGSRRWESLGPVGVGVLVAILALVFVGARLIVAADGDVSRFVVAGESFVDPATVRPPVHVFPSSGYDGQFYWRMAVDPANHDLASTHGVRLDQEIRFGRVAYPTLGWVTSFGTPTLVRWSLVFVNVVALGLIGGFAAAFARDRGGLQPAVGLLVAGSAGLITSLSRDLCEVVMVAGLVGGVVALGRRRPALASVGFAVAVLTHEQSLIVVAALAIWRCFQIAAGRARPGRDDIAWVGPLVVFAAWQLVCGVAWGRVPVLQSGGKNLDAPFVGIGRLIGRWLGGDIPSQQLLAPLQLMLIIAVVVVAVRRRSRAPEDGWLRVALGFGTLLAVCISYNVLKSPTEFRSMLIVPTLGFLAIFASGENPPRWLIGSFTLVAFATAGLRVLAI